jgi:pyrroline-5-carboxylate reductase
MPALALLGGGRMGEALVRGLLAAGWDAASLAVAEVDADRRRVLEEQFPGIRIVPSPAWAVADAEVVVIAVKPGDVPAALEQAAASLGPETLLLSIAAGVRLATVEACAPERPVVRAMPNVAALVGRAATAIAAGRHATDTHLDLAERILGAVGIVARVPESHLDAVTALSGSGPAYVFLLAEALIDAGVLAGLPRPVSESLTRETLLGAATLLAEGEPPEALRAAVTSPGGTTAAGLHVLEQRGVRGAVLDAVRAAAARSRELGEE